MNELAKQLDEKLCTLDYECARNLELRVRHAMSLAEEESSTQLSSGWPNGYFEQTAGALAREEFERHV